MRRVAARIELAGGDHLSPRHDDGGRRQGQQPVQKRELRHQRPILHPIEPEAGEGQIHLRVEGSEARHRQRQVGDDQPPGRPGCGWRCYRRQDSGRRWWWRQTRRRGHRGWRDRRRCKSQQRIQIEPRRSQIGGDHGTAAIVDARRPFEIALRGGQIEPRQQQALSEAQRHVAQRPAAAQTSDRRQSGARQRREPAKVGDLHGEAEVEAAQVPGLGDRSLHMQVGLRGGQHEVDRQRRLRLQ
jgi:hypothetical protein